MEKSNGKELLRGYSMKGRSAFGILTWIISIMWLIVGWATWLLDGEYAWKAWGAFVMAFLWGLLGWRFEWEENVKEKNK